MKYLILHSKITSAEKHFKMQYTFCEGYCSFGLGLIDRDQDTGDIEKNASHGRLVSQQHL